jgi:hypothetical protein
MHPRIDNLRRAAAGALGAGAALVALALPSSAQTYNFDGCGTVIQGVTCPKLFRDTANKLWLLQSFGSFQVGDYVYVTGMADPNCISICQQGNGCIANNTIALCPPDPSKPFCFCGSGAPCGNNDPSAGCANSAGAGSRLRADGTDSVSADDLMLTASQIPANKFGIVFMGMTQIAAAPFGDGQRCVGGMLFRFPVRNSGGAGVVVEGPIVGHANANFPPAGQIQAGSTWNFQFWYRDPGGPCNAGFNLSNAVAVAFTP